MRSPSQRKPTLSSIGSFSAHIVSLSLTHPLLQPPPPPLPLSGGSSRRHILPTPLAIPPRSSTLAMISSCPICNLRVLTAELERHADSHFEDDPLQRDMELAHQIALAESTTEIMVYHTLTSLFRLYSRLGEISFFSFYLQSQSGPERCAVSFTADSTNAQGTSSSHHGESELLDQQISCLVGAQVRTKVQEIQGGIMTLLRSCLESEGGSWTSIVSGHIDHHQSLSSEDKGWGCGWRNIQMLSSHLLNQRPEARQLLFGGSGFVPDIHSLQRWLEIAWDKEFDTIGSSHFHNKVYGAKKWIGTTECATLFRSFSLRARIVDFDSTESSDIQTNNGKRPKSQLRGPMDNFVIKNTPANSSSQLCQEEAQSMRGRQVLVDWVWSYFTSGCSDRSGMQQRVTASDKTWVSSFFWKCI
jgi:zinc finger-containing ubiquitin peptidase 1